MAIELAVGYVSIVPETSKLESGIKSAMSNAVKSADQVGNDIGKRLSLTASKAMRDGWRPDKDIMAGIPDTKLDRIGAHIGQVIGKGVAGALKGREAGAKFGHAFADGAGSVGIGSIVSKWRSGLSDNGPLRSLGLMAGKTFSAALTAAVGVGVAGVTMALTKGFDRLIALDTAQYKLKSILKSAGRDAKEVTGIVKDVTDSVTGTPFSLDQAFSTAVSAVGGGVKDIKRFMTDVADAAGFAGTDLDRIGLIFNQVQAKGKLTGEEMMQLMEAGLPAKSWIQDSYKLTSDQFERMQRDGEITMDMLQTSIERHAGGMSQALGNTLQGSIDNMQTSIAKVGANFLSAMFGGATGDQTEGLKSAVQRVTEMLNRLNAWIIAHKDDIKQFFDSAKEAAGKLLEVLGGIANALKEHPGLITAAVGAFAAFETIKGVAALLTSITAINTALGLMPGAAAAAGTGAAAGLAPLAAALGPITAGIAAIAGLGALGNKMLDNSDPQAIHEALGRRGLGALSGSMVPLGETAAGGVTAGAMLGAPGGGGLIGAAIKGASGFTMPKASGSPGRGFPLPWPMPTGGGAEGWRPAVQRAIAQYGPQLGIGNSKAWEDALVRQIQTESGGNPGADNPNDSNGLGGKQHVYGLLQFLPQTFNSHNISGGSYTDPNAQIAAALSYVKNRYGVDANGAPLQIGRGVGYDTGGWLPNGTQLVTNATGQPELILNPDQQKKLAEQGIDPNALLHGTANGADPGPSGPSAQSTNLNIDSSAGQGSEVAQDPQNPNYGMDFLRSMGFTPAAAANTAKAGTSSLAGFINWGSEITGGLINTGVNLGQMAASAAIAAGAASGSFGSAAAAAPVGQIATSYGLQLAGNEGKVISDYWFGLAGIGADSLMEIFSPFGSPRWLGYDYTQFAPQLGIQQAALSTLEKMGGDAITKAINPGGGGTVDPTAHNGFSAANPVGPAPMAAPPPPTPDPGTANTAPSGPAAAPPPPPDPLAGLFDSGGMLPPGGIGVNMTSRPEPVLTPQQWDAIAASSQAPANNGPLVQNLYAQDMQDAIRQLQKVQSRNMMQYAGRS